MPTFHSFPAHAVPGQSLSDLAGPPTRENPLPWLLSRIPSWIEGSGCHVSFRSAAVEDQSTAPPTPVTVANRVGERFT